MLRPILAATLTVAFCQLTYSHSGRTDANGGHHDRKNGGYHYHNGGYTPAPKPEPKTETPPQANSFFGRSVFRNTEPASEATRKPTKPKVTLKPKGRHWYSVDGKDIGKGNPEGFDKRTGVLTINDGVNDNQTIRLSELSVLDQGYVLDDFDPKSPYKKHQLKWTNSSGAYHVFATPLVVDLKSVKLLKTDGRVIDVKLAKLDSDSQRQAAELRNVSADVKRIIATIELDPFAGGELVESMPQSERELSTASAASR